MLVWGAVFLVFLAGVSALHQPAFIEDVNDRILERSSSRIVSGWEAQEGQIPYQISLRMVNSAGAVSSCGGSIIHEEWGLTAAHCTAMRVTMVIRAGCVNLTTPEYIFETTEYYNHPDYINELQTVVQPNDIGLLAFNRKLTWSWRVQPVRLQSSKDMDKDYAGVTMTASGWGRTWTSGSSPENMNWVYLRGTSNLLCWLAYSMSPIIVDSTICATYYNVTSQSTCQGDSGGVLSAIDFDGKVTQVGVTSFVSSSGCHTDIPAGFIRTGHYHEWYTSVTGIDFDWDAEEESITTEAATTATETESSETTTTEEAASTTDIVTGTTESVVITTEAVTITTEAVPNTTEADSIITEEIPAETTTEFIEPEPLEENEIEKVAQNFFGHYLSRLW